MCYTVQIGEGCITFSSFNPLISKLFSKMSQYLFPAGEIEAQIREAICPKSPIISTAEPDREPKSPDSQSRALSSGPHCLSLLKLMGDAFVWDG